MKHFSSQKGDLSHRFRYHRSFRLRPTSEEELVNITLNQNSSMPWLWSYLVLLYTHISRGWNKKPSRDAQPVGNVAEMRRKRMRVKIHSPAIFCPLPQTVWSDWHNVTWYQSSIWQICPHSKPVKSYHKAITPVSSKFSSPPQRSPPCPVSLTHPPTMSPPPLTNGPNKCSSYDWGAYNSWKGT